jgi:hypothetical protein
MIYGSNDVNQRGIHCLNTDEQIIQIFREKVKPKRSQFMLAAFLLLLFNHLPIQTMQQFRELSNIY